MISSTDRTIRMIIIFLKLIKLSGIRIINKLKTIIKLMSQNKKPTITPNNNEEIIRAQAISITPTVFEFLLLFCNHLSITNSLFNTVLLEVLYKAKLPDNIIKMILIIIFAF